MKNAMVIGADGGLGRLLTSKMIARFENVLKLDVNDPKHPFDISSDHDIHLALNRVRVDYYGHVNVVVNCAGINQPRAFDSLTRGTLEEHMAVNAFGLVRLVQALLRRNLLGERAVVCNVVSTAATWAMTNSLAYCASKAAALQATRVMARELRRTEDLTVFSVSPHVLAGTPMTESVYKATGKSPPTDAIPPEHVADLIAYLVSDKDRAYYLNGCDIPYGDPRQ